MGNKKENIHTQAACNVAATELKLKDITATNKESSFDPKGCWFDSTWEGERVVVFSKKMICF